MNNYLRYIVRWVNEGSGVIEGQRQLGNLNEAKALADAKQGFVLDVLTPVRPDSLALKIVYDRRR